MKEKGFATSLCFKTGLRIVQSQTIKKKRCIVAVEGWGERGWWTGRKRCLLDRGAQFQAGLSNNLC